MQSPPPPPPPPGGMPPPPPPGMPPPPPPMGGGYMPAPGMAAAANYGGFWIRAVAYIIDGILLGIVGRIIDAILQVNPSDPSSGPYAFASLIQLAVAFAYFSLLWHYQGASLGQRIFKLRVVDANTGQPVSIPQGLLRYVGLIIATLVCFIGLIWVAFDPRKQGWADKIAGTLVLQG